MFVKNCPNVIAKYAGGRKPARSIVDYHGGQ